MKNILTLDGEENPKDKCFQKVTSKVVSVLIPKRCLCLHAWANQIGGFVFVFSVLSYSNTDIKFYNYLFENDIFFHEDGGYTNGIAFNYAHGFDSRFNSDNTSKYILPLTKYLGLNNQDIKFRGVSYQLAQAMGTPEDIESKDIVVDQQPYAGLLMGRVNLYGFREKSSTRFGLILGVVGSASGAEKSQKIVHSLTGSDQPQGWSKQIKTEPVF